jgi:phage baseplate assembly protein W|tara:strand:- start:416 stop:844 length:429 start_codon:yes stop_codon:yes gene_type:complete
MASYDAGSLTNKTKKTEKVYKDLNLDFQQNSATKDIQKIENVESVKRSVRNLINLNYYEKPFHPEIGSNLRGLLFENITAQISHYMGKQVELLIRNYEPRCKMVEVVNRPDVERNGYSVSVSFYVVNTPDPIQVETFLERLR